MDLVFMTEEKLARNLDLIVQSYRTYSIVWEAVDHRAYQDTDRTLQFDDILISEMVPEEWFDNPAICPEPFFYDMGRDLAIMEENYLIKKAYQNARGTIAEIPQVRRANLVTILEEFYEMGNRSQVLFVPAELSVPLFVEAEGMEFADNRSFLRINPFFRTQLFITSKYVDLPSPLLMDRTFGTWIYIPGNRIDLPTRALTIEFHRLENANLRITSKMRIGFRIDRQEAARPLHMVPETS
jgi:hypothetical protein